MPNSLRGFFDEIEAPDRSLVVLNRTSPDPVRGLLDSLLDKQAVSISDVDSPEEETDIVALVEDGEVLARSTITELLESVLRRIKEKASRFSAGMNPTTLL